NETFPGQRCLTNNDRIDNDGLDWRPVNFLGGGRRDAAKVEFRRPSFLLLRSQDDRLGMELNRAHLRNGFLFALKRGPEIAKDEVAVFHERGMNREAPDAATGI